MKTKAKAAPQPHRNTRAKASEVAAHDGRSTPDAKIVLVKGATAQRGLMAKMVTLVAKRKGGVTRAEIAKACRGQPRTKVLKNVAWGIRHGVFGINLAA